MFLPPVPGNELFVKLFFQMAFHCKAESSLHTLVPVDVVKVKECLFCKGKSQDIGV